MDKMFGPIELGGVARDYHGSLTLPKQGFSISNKTNTFIIASQLVGSSKLFVHHCQP
jgi:hypothetical protein